MINSLLFCVASMMLPFGLWESPVTAKMCAQSTSAFFDMQASSDGTVYWTELIAHEQGRVALSCYRNGKIERLANNWNIRSRVHEYGGGAFCVQENGSVWVSLACDGQIYRLGEKESVTKTPRFRFADGSGPYWVGESHSNGEVENCIVRIEGDGAVGVVAQGRDFYSSPRLSPDGKQLAFVTWDHPFMPWDVSTLWLAQVGPDGCLRDLKQIAGSRDESICQVQWSKEGCLYFASDKGGFWNLHVYDGGLVKNLCPMEAEFAYTPWVFGRPSYAFGDEGKIFCSFTVKGKDHLGILDQKKGTFDPIDLPFTLVQNVIYANEKLYFFGASPELSLSIIEMDPKTCEWKALWTKDCPLDPDWISQGETISFPSKKGEAYGVYYPPKNPEVLPNEDELPPLIVRAHGGPTARAYHLFSLDTQFWTTRGFGVLDVNYSGSSGFGRAYAKRLEGLWGIIDVEDCIEGAQSLVDQKLADPKRLLIRGGSSGGYTTLCALANHQVFAGGTSLYGVSDLELLAKETHKFEAHYLDSLVAPYSEQREEFALRSPINCIDKVNVPLLLLQGENDPVVPLNQSQRVYDALLERSVPVSLLVFEDEGHGLRRAKSREKALKAELFFYCKILGLDRSDFPKVPPCQIEGL